MVIVRAETREDYPAVHKVNELAFGSPNEAVLIGKLRAVADPYISLVAEKAGQVVGHIFFSPVSIEISDSASLALGLGPMAILPDHQKQGLGSQLVREGLKECLRIGCEVVVVVGHPDYYPRFGFVSAKQKGLSCEYPVPDEVFMVLELKPAAPDGRRGLVKYLPEFNDA
jgi:putative acetyltransferase